MDSIKDIIPRVIAPLSSGKYKAAELGQWWQRHYGGNKNTSAALVKDGSLTVHVDCAARRVKMEVEREEYLKHVQDQFPGIKQINFKVGKIT